MAAASAVARRAFADARLRTLSFSLLFAVVAFVQAVAYREGYPTRAERLAFARTLVDNDVARLLYGEPHDLVSVGGYVSWRVGGGMAVFAALWALLGAVRAMRAEEDAGRADVVLAGVIGRRNAFLSQLAAIGAGAAVLWLALFVGCLAGRLPAGGAAYLALATISVVPVFAGVGAVAAQLAPTRRIATGLAVGVLVIAFALRAVAAILDRDSLHWTTPLGWAGELRPFADPQPSVLLLPAVAGSLLLAAAASLAARRDLGRGLLPTRDSAPPRLRLLGSPAAQALRAERGVLLAWIVGVGAFALLMGVISGAATGELISEGVQQQLEKLGTGSVVTPSGWLGFSFVFLILAVSLVACAQVSSIRAEEAEERLETLLALPVGRLRWFASRLIVAAAGVAAVALAAGFLAWVGAATQRANVSLPAMLGAGANTLPPALLFLAVGALAFAFVPRACVAITYGLVGATFVWELLGALLDVPGWLLSLSPFHDVGLVPGEPFEAGAAAIMLALAALVSVAAIWTFRRRDLAVA